MGYKITKILINSKTTTGTESVSNSEMLVLLQPISEINITSLENFERKNTFINKQREVRFLWYRNTGIRLKSTDIDTKDFQNANRNINGVNI